MNRKVLVILSVLVVPCLGFGEERSPVRIEPADSLFGGKPIKASIEPLGRKYYSLSSDRIRSLQSSGTEISLQIQDASKLDVDLFIHEGYPGSQTRVNEICSSQGTGSRESCRLFADDISSDNDFAVIEARAVGGARRTSFELTMRALGGPRLKGTRMVGEDATTLSETFDLGDIDSHEPILQIDTALTEFDPTEVYKVALPDSLPGPLTVDLIGSAPSGQSMIKIFDAAGFVIAESFEPGVNSAAKIPVTQQGQVVYVQVDTLKETAFLFSDYIEIALNFRLPSSISDVVMSTGRPIYYRSDTQRSFHLRFSPAQTAYMELEGCGDQPFLQEDLGEKVHVTPSSLQENMTLAFFGEPLVGFTSDSESILLAGQYADATMVQLEIDPTTSTSARSSVQQYRVPNNNRGYSASGSSDESICTVTAVVRDDIGFIVPFDSNRASTLAFENERGQARGQLSPDQGLVAFRISQRQLEQTGATGISVDLGSEDLDIAIVLSNGFVQSVDSSRVRWDWDRREPFAYVILFRAPLETDSVGDASYSLEYSLTYGVPNTPQFMK